MTLTHLKCARCNFIAPAGGEVSIRADDRARCDACEAARYDDALVKLLHALETRKAEASLPPAIFDAFAALQGIQAPADGPAALRAKHRQRIEQMAAGHERLQRERDAATADRQGMIAAIEAAGRANAALERHRSQLANRVGALEKNLAKSQVRVGELSHANRQLESLLRARDDEDEALRVETEGMPR